jgi:signal transduction histidine kinase
VFLKIDKLYETCAHQLALQWRNSVWEKRELLAGTLSEMRTPVAVIHGYVSIIGLEITKSPEVAGDIIPSVQSDILRLAEMLGQLMNTTLTRLNDMTEEVASEELNNLAKHLELIKSGIDSAERLREFTHMTHLIHDYDEFCDAIEDTLYKVFVLVDVVTRI